MYLTIMKLTNAILAGLMLGMAHGVSVQAGEDKITKGYYSMDAMGCMLLKECTKDVQRINSSIDLMNAYPDANWDLVKDEFDQIMVAFKKIGVNVMIELCNLLLDLLLQHHHRMSDHTPYHIPLTP